MKQVNSEQELCKAIMLVNKILILRGLKEEIQFEEFVRQIETYTDSVRWIDDHKQGENEDICLLFRRKFEGQAEQMWRLMEEENLINLYIWKNVKNQFQSQFPKVNLKRICPLWFMEQTKKFNSLQTVVKKKLRKWWRKCQIPKTRKCL